jgi:membrane fusion protein (multidrug efflux system)
MAKRMILMLAAVAVVLASIGIVKYLQVQAAIDQAAAFKPPPEAVTTIVAEKETWETTIEAIGSVAAVQGVMVSADLPGTVAEISFDSGRHVRRGEMLVRLDARQEQAQLRAADAERELARLNFERMQGLRTKGVVAEAELDAADARFETATARVGEIRATIDRKTIHAPFDGILGIRQVNLGQYLESGEPVVPLQSLHPIHVNFSVPQQQLSRVQIGSGIEVLVEGTDFRGNGTVTAIDSVVDEATRNVQVQATLPNTDKQLRPGMFVQTVLRTGAEQSVVPLPASAIHHAPYGDSVFVVADLEGPDGSTYRGVRQQFVKLGPSRGDQVAVTSGVEPGDEIVTSGVFKLRNGAAVQVDNTVQPANDPTPAPEES